MCVYIYIYIIRVKVNSNPCLELCNSYLSYLIPRMLEEAMRMILY